MKDIFEIIWAVFELIGALVRLIVMVLLFIVTMGPAIFIIEKVSKTKANTNDCIERMLTKYVVKIFNIGGIPIKESDLQK